ADDRMLERSESFLRANLADFLVAEDDGGSPAEFFGCGALAVLTADLAEVRSLAVKPEAGGRGVGKAIVDACVERARERGLRRVFLLRAVHAVFHEGRVALQGRGRGAQRGAAEGRGGPERVRLDENAIVPHL